MQNTETKTYSILLMQSVSYIMWSDEQLLNEFKTDFNYVAPIQSQDS